MTEADTMPEARATAPLADFLATLDSHTIYDLGWITVELRSRGYAGPVPYGMTHRQVFAAIEGRGLGGQLAAEDYEGQRYVAGDAIAATLCRQVTGSAPGDTFMGRGAAFRANLDYLRHHEQETTP